MTTSIVTVKKNNTALIVAVVLALAGVGAWVYQLVQGMQTTGLGQQIVWGLYIASFFTAVGAGAALLVLTGVSEYISLRPVTSRMSNLCLALSSFVVGALLITLDVGNPLRIWRILTAFSFSSLMTWDFWLLVLAGVITLVYLLSARNEKPQKALGALGIIAGLAVVVVEGWMLSSQVAHPMWGSGLIVLSFLLGAGIAGISIALIAGIANDTVLYWLKIGLVLSLVFVLAEVLTGLVSEEEGLSLVLIGFAAPAFWLQLIVGLLIPIVLLARKIYPLLAGILAVFGVVAEKVWLLAAGAAIPKLAFPQGVYYPTWVEFLAVIGMVALGILIYRLLFLLFKVE